MLVLPVDERLFEALGKVDAVDAGLGAEHLALQERAREVEALLMEKLGQLEQPWLLDLIVVPQHHVQVVPGAVLRPEGVGVQRLFWQGLELVAEVLAEEGQHAGILSSVVVLLQDLEHDDARPPVEGHATLETLNIGVALVGAKEAVFFLAC